MGGDRLVGKALDELAVLVRKGPCLQQALGQIRATGTPGIFGIGILSIKKPNWVGTVSTRPPTGATTGIVPYIMAYNWFKPQGSKREGIKQ